MLPTVVSTESSLEAGRISSYGSCECCDSFSYNGFTSASFGGCICTLYDIHEVQCVSQCVSQSADKIKVLGGFYFFPCFKTTLNRLLIPKHFYNIVYKVNVFLFGKFKLQYIRFLKNKNSCSYFEVSIRSKKYNDILLDFHRFD